MDALIGRTIGRYIITEKLGGGGMAVVYKARQPSLNRDVAVKILTGHLARDEEFVSRFRREAVAAGGLGHPNILTVHDAGTTDDGLHYIVMEYAPGGTLSQLLSAGPLPVEHACAIGAQIADALQVAHEHGIVHRDLKPSNVLLARDGRPLLMDFGVAFLARGTRLTRTGMAVGTPEYMSPEQAQGASVDERSDIYSLGILMYEMLTGDVPFASDTPVATLYRQVHETPPSLAQAGVPAWLGVAVSRALEKHPQQRYQTAREMATALRAGGATLVRPALPLGEVRQPAQPPASPGFAPVRRPRSRAAVWVAALAMAITAIAIGVYWLFFRAATPAGSPSPPTSFIATGQPTSTQAAVVSMPAQGTKPTTEGGQADTTTAVPATVRTVEARETAAASAALNTRVAAAQMATVAAGVAGTTQAMEREQALAALQSTRQVQTATAISLAVTVQANLAVSATAQAGQTLTAQERASQTAGASPSATYTPRPATSTVPPPTPTPARGNDICGWERGETWRRGDEPYGTLSASEEQVYTGKHAGRLQYDFPTADNDYVVFLRAVPLAGEPRRLNARVFGDESGHFLNAWFRDARGEIWQTTFGRINHRDWAIMSASLETGQDWPWGHVSGPDNGVVDYPIDFWALVLDDAPDTFTGSGVIYLDDVGVPRTPGAGSGPTPTAAPTPAPTRAAGPATLSGKIAFPVFNTQRGRYDVFIAQTDGAGRLLAAAQARQPAFRADGKLAVNGDGGGRDNIWMMNPDGGGGAAISRHPEDAHPSWSFDGGRIAFDSLLGRDKSAPRLYVHDDLSAKQEPRILMFGSYEIRGVVSTWLPDGRILFNGCNYWAGGSACGLYAVGEGGGEPAQLTASASDTAASSRGGLTVFMSRRDGNWEVYRMNQDGSDQRNLTNSAGNDGLPAWAPDAQWIAFVTDRGGEWAVWTMRPDGSAAQRLFPLEGGFGSGDYDWSLERISWSK